MKKSFLFCGLALILASFLVSCASSLQEDIHASTEFNRELEEEISIFENDFIKLDSEYILSGKKPSDAISDLQTKIEKHLAKQHMEPSISARLEAIEGLLCAMNGKTKKAQDFYTSAKTNHGGDAYVLILSARLCSSSEEALAKLDEILSFSTNNEIVLFEKGKTLYTTKEYGKSVAAFDEAFLICKEDTLHDYRDYYGTIRDTAWKLFNANIEDTSNMDVASITKTLTLESMVELTQENTTLLQEITGGSKLKTKDLISKMNSAGYFSAAVDANNKLGSSKTLLESKEITRIMCARYLWNLYIIKTGNNKLKTRYSTRYLSIDKSVSPIQDIEIENFDFDAVLGTVEAEIMELPDGKNFFPNEAVSRLDFITIINSIN